MIEIDWPHKHSNLCHQKSQCTSNLRRKYGSTGFNLHEAFLISEFALLIKINNTQIQQNKRAPQIVND
jgi:hypothetical protein